MIKDVLVDKVDTRISKSEDLKGLEIPKWSYFGVYPSHTTVGGTIKYRAHIVLRNDFNKKYIKVVGYYSSEMEAVLARDKYIIDNNLKVRRNFDDNGNRLHYNNITREHAKVISSLVGLLPVEDIASIINVNLINVTNYIKTHNISSRLDGNYVVIIDTRDSYG